MFSLPLGLAGGKKYKSLFVAWILSEKKRPFFGENQTLNKLKISKCLFPTTPQKWMLSVSFIPKITYEREYF